MLYYYTLAHYTLQGITVYYNGEVAVIRYIGPFDISDGTWLGLEMKRPCEQHMPLVSMTTSCYMCIGGKNDGSVQGRRYFTWSVVAMALYVHYCIASYLH